MKVIDLLDVFEIFSHPNDLYIMIGKSDHSGKYGFLISRGVSQKFKIILCGGSVYDNIDDVEKMIKKILVTSRSICLRELKNTESVLYPMYDPIRKLEVLTPKMINRIVKELNKKHAVDTKTL